MFIIKIRTFAEKTYLPLLLAMLFTFVSCSKEQLVGNAVKRNLKTAVSSMNGEQLFRGIFMMEGTLAYSIATLQPIKEQLDYNFSVKPEYQQNLQILNNEVVTKISEIYPNFFNDFATGVRSSDPYVVQQTLINASKVYKQCAFLSQKFMTHYNFAVWLRSNTNFENEVASFDLSTEQGITQFDSKVKQYWETYKVGKDELEQCAPVVAFCMVYVVAGAFSYVVTIHSVVSTAALVLAVAAWVAIYNNDDDTFDSDKLAVLVNEISIAIVDY